MDYGDTLEQNWFVYNLHYIMLITFNITHCSPLDHTHGRQYLG